MPLNWQSAKQLKTILLQHQSHVIGLQALIVSQKPALMFLPHLVNPHVKVIYLPNVPGMDQIVWI